MLAHSDGTEPQVFGAAGEFPWASWSADGEQIVTLSIKGLAFVDVASRKTLRTLERKGFFQQLIWSPDGTQFACLTRKSGAVTTNEGGAALVFLCPSDNGAKKGAWPKDLKLRIFDTEGSSHFYNCSANDNDD